LVSLARDQTSAFRESNPRSAAPDERKATERSSIRTGSARRLTIASGVNGCVGFLVHDTSLATKAIARKACRLIMWGERRRIDGQRIAMQRRAEPWPDPFRLQVRFDRFAAAA
jgi:hypothetical protein